MKLSRANRFFFFFLAGSQLVFAQEPVTYLDKLISNLQIANSTKTAQSDILAIGPIELPHERSTIQDLSNLYKKQSADRIKAQSDPAKKGAVPLYEQAELLSLADLSKKQSILVMNQLILVITKLFDLLEYWQRINNRPFLYYATHWPTKLFEQKTLSSIAQESIKNIKEGIYYYTFFLGNIYRSTHALASIQSEEEFKARLAKTALLINACMNHEPFEQTTGHMYSNQELHELLMHNHEIAHHFETSALMRVEKHQKPGHFERNWLRYTVGSVAALGGLIYFKTHQQQIGIWAENTKNGVAKLFKDNLYDPIKNIIDVYFSKKQPNEISVELTKIDMAQFNDETKTMLIDYLGKKFPSITPNEINSLAQKMIQNKDTSPIADDMKYAHNSTGKAYLYGQLPAALIGYRINIGALGDGANKKIDEANVIVKKLVALINQQQVNVQLLLTLPVVVTAAGLYVLYRQANKVSKNLLSDHRNPVREGLINIENTLNKFNKIGAIVPFEAEGLILYWLSKLRCHVPHMAEHHKAQFEEDLSQISSPDFELHQKLATIDRMYRTYDFLGFGPQRKMFFSYGAQSFLNSTVNRERSLFSTDVL
jgi:hypothetical protein